MNKNCVCVFCFSGRLHHHFFTTFIRFNSASKYTQMRILNLFLFSYILLWHILQVFELTENELKKKFPLKDRFTNFVFSFKTFFISFKNHQSMHIQCVRHIHECNGVAKLNNIHSVSNFKTTKNLHIKKRNASLDSIPFSLQTLKFSHLIFLIHKNIMNQLKMLLPWYQQKSVISKSNFKTFSKRIRCTTTPSPTMEGCIMSITSL